MTEKTTTEFLWYGSPMFNCGLIFFGIQLAEDGYPEKLVEMLTKVCETDPYELHLIKLEDGGRPFAFVKPENIERFPDPLWEESIVNPNVDLVDTDTQSMVSRYNDEVFLRWSLPSPEAIRACTSIPKLIQTAVFVLEELVHLNQIKQEGILYLTSTETPIELSSVKLRHMTLNDKQLLMKIRETDVTYCIGSMFLGRRYNLPWYVSRLNSSQTDIHKPLDSKNLFNLLVILIEGYSEESKIRENLIAIVKAIDLLTEYEAMITM